jgi:hypothetical protein
LVTCAPCTFVVSPQLNERSDGVEEDAHGGVVGVHVRRHLDVCHAPALVGAGAVEVGGPQQPHLRRKVRLRVRLLNDEVEPRRPSGVTADVGGTSTGGGKRLLPLERVVKVELTFFAGVPGIELKE